MAHHQQQPYSNGGQAHIDYSAQLPPSARKRSRINEELNFEQLGLQGTDDDDDDDDDDDEAAMEMDQHGHPQRQMGNLSSYHHHHHLPDSSQSPTLQRGGLADTSDSSLLSAAPPSVVGQAGMPAPAPHPRGPKLKFTPEDDQLLVDLKENKSLTWKQIAEFFPGRSSGTLQVRYCTKLKAKTTQWTDETVSRLRNAMHEYENDRWRLIATKVGSGFSPAACRQKAEEFTA
ncbi:MAG: hypothetical protein M1836_006700 [Candelina mexicana]|nr:MAG: hypothetical protein M1836_006700 [Candelina mexicana]